MRSLCLYTFFTISIFLMISCDDNGKQQSNNNNNNNNNINSVCGNDVQEGSEPCDGSDFGNRTCATEGYHEGGTLACSATCTLDVTNCQKRCGNGFVEPGEECDTGDNADPGCSESCEVNPGWSCSGQPSECIRTCGNGMLDPGEVCEGTDIGDAVCANLGWGYGVPSCTENCELDRNACFTITSIAAGYYHTCAVDTQKRVWCWGDNLMGQLGNGTMEMRSAFPVRIPEISNALDVVAGEYYTCVLLEDHTVKCWGSNISFELGNGTGNPSTTPVPVTNVTDAVALSAGRNHTCAVQQAGTIRCWGDNFDGKLGTTGSPPLSVAVTGIDNAVLVTAGENHTCALLSDQTVKCWGSHAFGQLGTGTNIPNSATPVVVAGLSGVDDLAAGGLHTCAVLSDHTVKCWGSNANVELGDGTTNDANAPVTSNATGVRVKSGGFHTCVLGEDGLLSCWGSNDFGQLGAGSNEAMSTSALEVNQLVDVSVFSAGYQHNCAVGADQIVKCWGDNSAFKCGANGDSFNEPVAVSSF